MVIRSIGYWPVQHPKINSATIKNKHLLELEKAKIDHFSDIDDLKAHSIAISDTTFENRKAQSNKKMTELYVIAG